jgi:hypothetical protein
VQGNSKLILFQFLARFQSYLHRAATQLLFILYPNVAELADVRVHYIKLLQMLAKEVVACIYSKLGDLGLPTVGHFTVSFD